MQSLESDTDEKKGLACLAYSQKYITLYKKIRKKEEKKTFFNEIHNFLIAFYY